MPKGVYKRTNRMRRNISLARRGIVPWNKGTTKYRDLLTRINWLLIIYGPSSLSEIYSHVSNEISYKRLQWLLSKARANGLIDPALIRENRGLMKNKGGGRPAKFQVGDKVRIAPKNKRTPQWLLDELRADTPRTIVQVVKTDNQVCLYLLGTNSNDSFLEFYSFRPNELVPYVKGTVGRPRLKRAYNRNPDGNNGTGIKSLVHTDKKLSVDLMAPPSISCVNSLFGLSDCVHHWYIDNDGKGRCLKCKAERDFCTVQTSLRCRGEVPMRIGN